MFESPAQEWNALTAHYRSMGDEELLELAESFADLRPVAQQVLSDEMKLRGLGDPQARGWSRRRPDPVPEAGLEGSRLQGAVEYTWKTPLCQCANPREAWQISEALKRAGIESWVERSNSYTVHAEFEEAPPRVLVAADEVEAARTILEQPIPADIVEESRLGVPEYEIPVCPRCGAADPLLESVDPVNQWSCEACGAEWEDADREDGPDQGSGG